MCVFSTHSAKREDRSGLHCPRGWVVKIQFRRGKGFLWRKRRFLSRIFNGVRCPPPNLASGTRSRVAVTQIRYDALRRCESFFPASEARRDFGRREWHIDDDDRIRNVGSLQLCSRPHVTIPLPLDVIDCSTPIENRKWADASWDHTCPVRYTLMLSPLSCRLDESRSFQGYSRRGCELGRNVSFFLMDDYSYPNSIIKKVMHNRFLWTFRQTLTLK